VYVGRSRAGSIVIAGHVHAHSIQLHTWQWSTVFNSIPSIIYCIAHVTLTSLKGGVKKILQSSLGHSQSHYSLKGGVEKIFRAAQDALEVTIHWSKDTISNAFILHVGMCFLDKHYIVNEIAKLIAIFYLYRLTYSRVAYLSLRWTILKLAFLKLLGSMHSSQVLEDNLCKGVSSWTWVMVDNELNFWWGPPICTCFVLANHVCKFPLGCFVLAIHVCKFPLRCSLFDFASEAMYREGQAGPLDKLVWQKALAATSTFTHFYGFICSTIGIIGDWIRERTHNTQVSIYAKTFKTNLHRCHSGCLKLLCNLT
jgi:hypothetical protein